MFTEVRQSRLRTEEKINRILTTWVKVQRALDIVSTVVHGKLFCTLTEEQQKDVRIYVDYHGNDIGNLKVSEIPTDFDEFVGK